MNLTKKAENSELELAVVEEIAKNEGIEVGSPDEELSNSDAMKLGVAVKKFIEDGEIVKPVKGKTFRVWSPGKNKTIFLGQTLGSIRVRDHSLVLDVERDAKTIKLIKSLRNVLGLYKVHNKPFDEDSEQYERFEDLLRQLVFTGAGQEASRGGVKAVRALFSSDELQAMGENAFNPKRLITKATRSKSITQIHNV
jgi:hypothetical protein